MSDINPNTPVTAPDPISHQGQDVPATFDELEAVLAKPKSSSKQAKASESEKEEKAEPKKQEKSIDLSDDRDKSPKKEAKSEAKKPAEDKEDGKEAAKAKLEEKARKTRKAKVGDADLDIDEEAVFGVPVNGSDEPVSLRDLISNYSGKTAWDKKFTELTKEKQGFQSKLEESNAKIKAIFEQQDPDLRFYALSQFAGVDPIQYRNQYLNENLKLLEKWQSMSEDERKADALAFENKVLKHKAETSEKALSAEQAKIALTTKINGLLATHKIPKEQFQAYEDQVTEMVRSGNLDKEKLTPEFIVEAIQKDKIWNAVSPVLENSGLEQAALNSKVRDLVETAFEHGLSPQDAADLADEMWGNKKKSKVISEKARERDEFLNGKRPPEAKFWPSEASFFDDL